MANAALLARRFFLAPYPNPPRYNTGDLQWELANGET